MTRKSAETDAISFTTNQVPGEGKNCIISHASKKRAGWFLAGRCDLEENMAFVGFSCPLWLILVSREK
jgi:hypothetical protein